MVWHKFATGPYEMTGGWVEVSAILQKWCSITNLRFSLILK